MDDKFKNLKNLLDLIQNHKDLNPFAKSQISSVLSNEINFEGEDVELYRSSLTYLPKQTSHLQFGDIIDLELLDTELTKINEKKLGGKKFSESYYPYFFSSYQYAFISTQTCNLEHSKTRTIEICAIKDFNRVCTEFLKDWKKGKSRSKVVNSDFTERVWEKFKKLLDQQLDENYFVFPTYYEDGTERFYQAIGCLDIKIPIRMFRSLTETNKPAFEKSKVASLQDIYRSKLSVQLAEQYLKVPLEDNKSLFKQGDTEFKDWVSRTMTKQFFYLDPVTLDSVKNIDPNVRKELKKDDVQKFKKFNDDIELEMESFIDSHFSADTEVETIWADSDFTTRFQEKFIILKSERDVKITKLCIDIALDRAKRREENSKPKN